jgi:hypothetical protein
LDATQHHWLERRLPWVEVDAVGGPQLLAMSNVVLYFLFHFVSLLCFSILRIPLPKDVHRLKRSVPAGSPA